MRCSTRDCRVEPLLLALEGGLGLAGAQLGLVLLLVELELVGDLRGLLVPPLAGAEHLALQLEVLQVLRLLLGGALELELGARLDRLVVHLLEPIGRAVAAIDDLVDPVAALRRPATASWR